MESVDTAEGGSMRREIACLVVAALCAAGCSTEAAHTASTSQVPPPLPVTSSPDGSVTASVSAASGGVVRNAAGAELIVPPHVLQQDATAFLQPQAGGVVEIHLSASWTGTVQVGLPVDADAADGALLGHQVNGQWRVEDATLTDGDLIAAVDSLSPFKIFNCLKKITGGEKGIVECLLKNGIKSLPKKIAKKIGLDIADQCGDITDLSSWLGSGACHAGDPTDWQKYLTPSPSSASNPPAPKPSSPQPMPPATGSVQLAQGPTAPQGYRYAITISGFPANADVPIKCYDSISSAGFYAFTMHTSGTGSASTQSACYSGDGPDHWVTAAGVSSNHVQWSAPPPPPPPAPTTYPETVGGQTHTWTNYTNAGGNEGPTINAYTTVSIACKLPGFRVQDGNTWWYRIASSPWNGQYYASADAFYNNGQTSGSLHGTPWVDNTVPNC